MIKEHLEKARGRRDRKNSSKSRGYPESIDVAKLNANNCGRKGTNSVNSVIGTKPNKK